MDANSVLSAQSLRKEYGKGAALVRAVDDVSLDVAQGESVAIVGPSGCGKSTLLYLLGGLERPSAGTLTLEGRQLEQMPETGLARLRRHALGFVFQAFHLVDELTALENIELPALLAGSTPRAARERARELLDQVGLEDRAEHLPSALSGGQRQRVAIARALANSPLVVLADEPTGNLDSAATTDVLRLFEQLHAGGQTLVVVTHDERIAATADRVITMRDGRFVSETKLAGGTARGPHGDGRAGGLTPWAGCCSSPAWSSATSSADGCSRRCCWLMIVTTTTTLTLGLALHEVTDSPFARTRAATRGPDIVAQIAPPPPLPVAPPAGRHHAQFAALTRARGVVGDSGPYPVALARLTAPRDRHRGAGPGPGPRAGGDRPAELTAGSWVRPGGAVIERGFADALGLHVGSAIHLNGRSFRVSGIAVSTAQCFYPVSTPGLIWVTRGEAEELATPQEPLGYVLNLKLADPNSSPAFLNGPAATAFGNSGANDTVSLLNDWRESSRATSR